MVDTTTMEERMDAVRTAIADDADIARAVLYAVIEPILRETRELTGDTHTEAAWLRKAIDGYEMKFCPHCLQDRRKDSRAHLPDCPVGLALAHADTAGQPFHLALLPSEEAA
jgi:hypothetical protein